MSTADTFTFRRLNLLDVERVAALENICFPFPWTRQLLIAELGKSTSFSYGVQRGDELVGYVIARLVPDELHVLTLGIQPEFRRQNLATDLLSLLLKHAAESGGRIATLEVRASNEGAQRLYQKTGFFSVGLRKGYYGDNGEDAHLFTAILGSPECMLAPAVAGSLV